MQGSHQRCCSGPGHSATLPWAKGWKARVLVFMSWKLRQVPGEEPRVPFPVVGGDQGVFRPGMPRSRAGTVGQRPGSGGFSWGPPPSTRIRAGGGYICARLMVRSWANQPSSVRKVWGLAVCASRMMPDPSS